MRALRLKRRTLLKGLLQGSAVTVALPPLEAMFNASGSAHADGTGLPRRLGVFFWGNGVRLAHWVPMGGGSNYLLSKSLEPLLAVREYLSVVSGMDLKIPNSQGHHTGSVGILSGAPLVEQPKGNAAFRSTFSKASLDQIAAAEIGTSTRFKSLEVGISRRLNRNEGTTLQYLSHNGPDSANPPLYAPRDVFTRLFGGDFKVPAQSASVSPDKLLALRKSVLDAVMADIDHLKLRVSSRDGKRLDQHLENVRGIEKRLQTTAGAAGMSAGCTVPGTPALFPDVMEGEQLEPIMRAMSALVAVALACDQTRVFSLLFSGSVASTIFWPVGVTKGHHGLTHDEPGEQPEVQATTVYTMKMLAILLEALKNTSDGLGNLLDNVAIMASTDCAEGKPHSIKDYPILVAGRGGGALRYPGVHYRSLKAENTSSVGLSVLRAAGANVAQFGDGTGAATSGCSAIESG